MQLVRAALYATAFLLVGIAQVCEGAAATDVKAGQQVFSACAACHGLDGTGGEHAPNIATDPRIQQMPNGEVLAIVRKGIPAGGMPGFSHLLNDEQIGAVVAYLRMLQRPTEAGQVPGDAAQGRELFFGSGGCAECHMVNGQGGFFAADLSGYGQSHPAAAIRGAIIAPDKDQDPHRGTVTVQTRAGKRYRGAVRNEDNFSLQIQTVNGSFLLFDKSELLRIEHESRSGMPSDHQAKLTSAQLQNLVKFLSESSGAAPKSRPDEDEE